jgi:hypothetical protein
MTLFRHHLDHRTKASGNRPDIENGAPCRSSVNKIHRDVVRVFILNARMPREPRHSIGTFSFDIANANLGLTRNGKLFNLIWHCSMRPPTRPTLVEASDLS